MLAISSPDIFQKNVRQCFRAAIISTQEHLCAPFAILTLQETVIGNNIASFEDSSFKENIDPAGETHDKLILAPTMCNSSEEKEELARLTKFSVNLENGILNYTIQEANSKKIIKKWENPLFVQIYKDRCRSVFMNLKHASVISQIMESSISPQELAFATHQEMAPNQWKELIERKTKRDTSKYVNNTCASTDMFTCSKCRSTKCTYYELQTRSADEPMTVFVSCRDCGKNWKQ